RLPDHAAQGPLGTDLVPQHAARIDAFEMAPVEAPAMLVEIPPGHAVLAEQQARSGSDQRLQRIDDAGQRMALEGENDEILRAELARIGCHPGPDRRGL